MELDPTSDSLGVPHTGGTASPKQERRWLFVMVAIALAVQVAVASAAFLGPRPSRYGWQMYTAVPYIPRVWGISGEDEREVAIDQLLVNARAEIDYVALIRSRGCDLVDADALRIEHDDARVETVMCS